MSFSQFRVLSSDNFPPLNNKLLLYIISGFLFHFAMQIFLLLWVPHPDESYLLYVVSGTWGFAEAIWQTLINGI